MAEPSPSTPFGDTPKKRPFDASVPNDMARFINLTDTEVSDLIRRTMSLLHAQGEYDQNDVAVLEWDGAMDLATLAALLWQPTENEQEPRS